MMRLSAVSLSTRSADRLDIAFDFEPLAVRPQVIALASHSRFCHSKMQVVRRGMTLIEVLIATALTLLIIPYESHGYRGRQSVLHTQSEMLNWFNQYVRDAK